VNIDQLRSETPGCRQRIHLNNAGAALMPDPVIRAIQDHITLESTIGGYEAAESRQDAIQDAYLSVADLVGTRPANIAFTENATTSYMQALSSIPFARDDVILTTRNDYASNQIQFLSLRSRLGVRVMKAPDQSEGGVDVEAMADLIRRHHPRLVCVTHVPTNSGLVQDVAAIGSVCRDEGVLYLVDACQSIGQMTVNVNEIGCDFLSASSRKFLRGPRGAGFLYVSDRVLAAGLEPLFIDMRGADWIAEDRYRAASTARRFENWEFAWALVLGTGAAARYATAIGLEPIRDRVRALAGRLREALGAIDGVRVLDRGSELCGIVSVWIDGWEPRELVARLQERRINASAQVRVSAVIDYDEKGVSASLRLSPHYYNTEEEIDRTAAAIEELMRRSQ
jgi:selenocysteine lyase/cysteine desulfurase